MVSSFTKKSWVSTSSHTIHYEGTTAADDEVIKLARKTNTDPDNRPWLILPVESLERLAAATAEEAGTGTGTAEAADPKPSGSSMTEEGIPHIS